MKVEMLTSMAGQSPYAPPGRQIVGGMILDLPPRIAEAWLAEGYCKKIELKEEASK
jgi:hypothetical protein